MLQKSVFHLRKAGEISEMLRGKQRRQPVSLDGITALILTLCFIVVGGVYADDIGDGNDSALINWRSITPVEAERLIERGDLDPNGLFTQTIGDRETLVPPIVKVIMKKGDLDVIDVLVAHGADIDKHHGKHNQISALKIALYAGEIDIAKRLLELGADPNPEGDGKPAIFYALTHVDLEPEIRREMIELLLNFGADINELADAEKNFFVIFTPLMEAVVRSIIPENRENYAGLIPYMVSDLGADVNLFPSGSLVAAMHIAALGEDTDVIRELVLLGGDVNIVSGNDCWPPLFFFVVSGQSMEVFDFLISEGANIDYICPSGENILDFIEYRIKVGSNRNFNFLFGPTNNREKFSTVEEWREFGRTIKARLVELCEERRDDICNALEEST